MANPPSPVLLLLSLIVGCSGQKDKEGPKAVAAPASRPSLVIATLDTTRADRIGAYGYPLAVTPTVDRLAAEGTRFARAYASVPLTTPSHSSMFSGLYPTRHGVHTNGDAILPDSVTTLAELLHEAGYHTGASVSAFVTTRVWNLDQGFDAYRDAVDPGKNQADRWGQERRADEVVDDAIAWLGEVPRDQPFFLWVHFYDPHAPYKPPAQWAERLPGRPYDGEIAFMDEQLGRLYLAVDARQQADGVAWMAVADHGEALKDEHGEHSHGMYLYDATTRVPFVVRPATPQKQARVVDQVTVGNVDLMPTALGLLGMAVPTGLDGVDLSPWVRGEKTERTGVYMESYTATQRFGYHPEIAVAHGKLKLMDTPSPRLFDLEADPGENTNLAASRPEEVARLHQVTEAVQKAAVAQSGAAVAPEVVEQLAALGYLGAGGDMTPTDSTVDAKDRTDTIQSLEKARALSREPETVKAAESAYKAILEKEPQIVEARLGLATLLQRQGRLPEAEQVYRDALQLDPTSTVLLANHSRCLAMMGRLDEALGDINAVLGLVPGDENARVMSIRLLDQLGRSSEALAKAQAWLAESPESANLQASLGILLGRAGDLAQAQSLLESSLSDGVPRQFVHELLARIATQNKDAVGAEAHLRAELDAFPNNPTARMVLANLYMTLERWDEAASEYQYVAEHQKADPTARRAWAQAIFNAGDYPLAQEILAPALKAAPNDARVLLLQANILEKLGNREEGEKLFERARALRALEKADGPPQAGAPTGR